MPVQSVRVGMTSYLTAEIGSCSIPNCSASKPVPHAQALGSLLQLAPCPFWRLEAAVAPGPRLPPEEPPSKDEAAASDASAPVENNSEGQPQASPALLGS